MDCVLFTLRFTTEKGRFTTILFSMKFMVPKYEITGVSVYLEMNF